MTPVYIKSRLKRLRKKGYNNKDLVELYLINNPNHLNADERKLRDYANKDFTKYLQAIVEEERL